MRIVTKSLDRFWQYNADRNMYPADIWRHDTVKQQATYLRWLVRWVGAAAFLGLVLAPATSMAQTGKLFTYKPPVRGVPSAASRVGGGTRGTKGQAFVLNALAPSHVANTMRTQPTLYWFSSRILSSAVEVVIADQEAIDPLLEVTLSPPITAGIQAVSLHERGVELKPGVDYQWYVAIVLDPQHRSKDIIAGGDIRLTPASGALQEKLEGAGDEELPALLAESGLWYDVVDELNSRVRRNAGDQTSREQRADLLEQAGLKVAAAQLRRAGR